MQCLVSFFTIKKSKELFIARDYLGIIPLYYYHEKNLIHKRFLVASEMKCFYGLRNKDVKLFPHGHYAKIVNGEGVFNSYLIIK